MYEEELKKFFNKLGIENMTIRCYGIGGHFFNVELRTTTPISSDIVNVLFEKKFFNIKIIDSLKTKLILNMEIYEENLKKV